MTDASERKTARRSQAAVRCASLQILAAEDNKTNQFLLTAMLEPLGVHLSLADDGREALALFREDDFDLVLMDIQMPGMNGVDAARAIRAFERADGRRPTPMLALSANAMRHQVEEYLAAGMDGFIAKPIDMATLVSAIEVALASAAGPERPATAPPASGGRPEIVAS